MVSPKLIITGISLLAVTTLNAEDPTTKKVAWIMFMAGALISTVVYSICAIIISRKKDSRMIEVPVEDPSDTPIGRALGATKPADGGKVRNITVQQYDAEKLREFALQRTLMPSLIIIFMHMKMGTVVPLVLQCLNGLMGLWDSEIVKIHLRGMELERPFKASGLLDMLTGGSSGRGGLFGAPAAVEAPTTPFVSPRAKRTLAKKEKAAASKAASLKQE